MRITGVDVGGAHTDIIAFDAAGGEIAVHKVPKRLRGATCRYLTVIRIAMIETYLAVRSRSRPRRTFFVNATVS
ncbi:hypothetical protein [Pseudonocardia acidicola]|uniref:Hydantoinase/oxoprolinase N-terminal domain-containing protein n=1 Tax=Pseudonocardia acidicola TaxID=2724939 RepID=A0ABX1SA52_9PSEU|nr:hypothetical protein [Pseudonocardia acidicola]NMH98440.1 hypothetical protein [Pseudonocardia acidicola]